MNLVRKIAIFATLALSAAVFAQEEPEAAETATETAVESPAAENSYEQPAAEQEPVPQTVAATESAEPKKDDDFKDRNIGIKGGFHLSGISGQDLSLGYVFGVSYGIMKFLDWNGLDGRLGLKLVLEPELLFVPKSTLFTGEQYWFELPVLVSFKFAAFKNYMNIDVGPYVAFGAFGDFKDKLTEEKQGRFDIGLAYGIQYDYPTKIATFSSSALFQSGFMNLYEDSGSKSFSIKVMLGVHF